jgi:hypothetical protein
MTHAILMGPTAPPPRRNRNTVILQRNSITSLPPAAVVNKTKFALCFLCLFDGLHTPTIRRLVRKPRTVCTKSLLTFDPQYYAPASESALQDIYRSSMKCPCSITVDPAVPTVLSLLKSNGTAQPPGRLIFHYYGHGSHAPLPDGSLYFFSEDRTKYKPLKIVNVMNTSLCPLTFIFDCPSAACLAGQLKTRKDVFAFFACDAEEKLPLSTHAPMDLFSSALLLPYDTAIWWHMQRHSSVYAAPRAPSPEHRDFLENFLMSVLDAIAFESRSSRPSRRPFTNRTPPIRRWRHFFVDLYSPSESC